MLYLLDEMRLGQPERRPVEDLIRAVLRGLKRVQYPTTGLWRNVLDNPGARVGCSGSTGFARASARGTATGIKPAYHLARQQGRGTIPQYALALVEAERAGIGLDK